MPTLASRRAVVSLLAVAPLAWALSACGGSGTADVTTAVDVPFVRLQALWPAQSVEQTYVIRTEAEWAAAWSVHEPLIVPPIPRPSVDFGRDMVLGLSRGSGPNGCHGLTIVRVVEEASQRVVHFRLSEPTAQQMCTQVIVALTDFVTVPRSDKPVVFRRAEG